MKCNVCTGVLCMVFNTIFKMEFGSLTTLQKKKQKTIKKIMVFHNPIRIDAKALNLLSLLFVHFFIVVSIFVELMRR